MPWRWTYLAQHRREVTHRRSRLASLYRLHWFVCIDVALHLLILFAVRVVASTRFLRFLYRHVIPRTVIHGWKVSDESSAMLVMEHELFRHIEIELFVPSQSLAAALEDIRTILTTAGDVKETTSKLRLSESECPGADDPEIAALRGTYCHHYPICIRKVLADDTLISMAAGDDQVWYAISLISYAHVRDRDGFHRVAGVLAKTLADRYGARPHWGKVCPLTGAQLTGLYPNFDRYREICQASDPAGAFRNHWMNSMWEDVERPTSPQK